MTRRKLIGSIAAMSAACLVPARRLWGREPGENLIADAPSNAGFAAPDSDHCKYATIESITFFIPEAVSFPLDTAITYRFSDGEEGQVAIVRAHDGAPQFLQLDFIQPFEGEKIDQQEVPRMYAFLPIREVKASR
jgi:hypothetical protein